MIQARGLGRRFGDRWAVEGVDLELLPGEVFGLLGPNGAGKTTTVRMLTALIAPTAGRASVGGFDVVEAPDEVRRRVGLLTETPSLYERLSAMQNLAFFGRLQELSSDVVRERGERLLRLFELWDRRDDLAGTLSKGMKQKLAIARALLHEPSVLFLDEPTSGLDPEAAFIVREAIEALKAQGRTIVLATHNLDEAERLADRVAFVRGRLLRVDSPARLRSAAAEPSVVFELAGAVSGGVIDDLARRPEVRSVALDGSQLTVGVGGVPADVPPLIRWLSSAGAPILAVRPVQPSLETVYFDVMGVVPAANGAQS